MLSSADTQCATTVPIPHTLRRHTVGMNCVCLLSLPGPGPWAGEKDHVLGILTDPPLETVSGPEQTKLSGSSAERMSVSHYQCTFLVHSELLLCLLPAHPHCPPDVGSSSSAASSTCPHPRHHSCCPRNGRPSLRACIAFVCFHTTLLVPSV